MAGAIIVATREIYDLLVSVNPDLEQKPAAFSKELTTVLRPALNRVVKACRTPDMLNDVIEQQRKRVAACRTTAQAFELFVANMMNAGD